jgi:hypothetical protein
MSLRKAGGKRIAEDEVSIGSKLNVYVYADIKDTAEKGDKIRLQLINDE